MTLATTYLGLKLAHPFMLGASPLTADLDNVRRVEDGGCAAVVMHSLFEEQIGDGSARQLAALEAAGRDFAAAFAHFPLAEAVPHDPEHYLEQIRRIKEAVSIPLIGSLNGSGPDGWLRFAPLIEQAGADALELNVYYLPTALEDSAAGIEERIESVVRSLRSTIRIPLAVKLTPFYTGFANFALRLEAAGADGLVLFNRFYHPDIDVETLQMLPNLRLSTSAELQLRLHWIATLSEKIRTSLAVTGGVHTALDGIKALLSGAHAVQMVSAVLQQGPKHFKTMEDGVRYWMTRHRFDTIDAFRGRANLTHRADPDEFERSAYRRVLQTWNS
jgi:dihydroorotate dehydrogenase (fumarate)